MSPQEHLSLLAGGEPHTREEWEKAAADVLRKTGRMKAEDSDALVWSKLTRTTLDGIEITPLGTPLLVADVPEPGEPGLAPYTRGSVAGRADEGWDVRAHYADPDAEQSARDVLTDLENGVTSLWLQLGEAGIAVADLPVVLEDVLLDLAPVVLDAPDDPVAAARAYADLLDEKGKDAAPGTSLGGDPLGVAVRHRANPAAPAPGDLEETVRALAEIARERGTYALTVDATAVHDLGATDAQELGYSLAAGAGYLRALTASGLDVATAASLVEFRYAATDEQFPTIAKLRAARRLWQRVLELSGVADAAGQVQHVVTSRPMMSKYDPWVNMLRTTVAAFAAGVGGATSVTVLPFDSAIGLPDTLARRNARNTSSLLISESHVARVTDPAGGSYAVERLTDDLAHAGWAQLQQIEGEGGVLASLDADDGLLVRVQEQAVTARDRQVATRRRPVTGVSEFPNLAEELPARKPWPAAAVPVRRYGQPFEEMRDAPVGTPVLLATLGPIAQHTARATFAANLLAAGGIDTVVAGATEGPDDLVAAFSEAGTSVVCLAGTDQAYAEWGAAAVSALREAGATYVILAGKPGESTVDSVDDSCATGVDALAFLTRVREELGK
ncbi:methylmalonyl-CoA mutase family protein [Nocardioides marmoribigeumensis]|uniref:Methylmalonyl-CoA mutase n=1 Tax=Nocardioides marmoribigeumensis TaxID=433649 RepID=A0ABU2BZX0_9ACTN|nr:methylmalonyl-CoA mutase family protein [Nocardioides marmoribigeumensis]MDR7363944.1 methylmalonyl-CoA mutase [Nocardioides marmoribigeumensis]